MAMALGICAAGALPPYHLVFMLVPALGGLVWLIAVAARPRDAFVVGWWFGVGHCGAGYYWIAHSLLVNPEQHAWLIPIAVIGFAAVLGAFPALVAGALYGLRRCLGSGPATMPGLGTALGFAALWVLSEWLRSWLFTGFPWNLMASIWVFSDTMVQAASVIGVYGLGLVTVFAAALPMSCLGGSRASGPPMLAAMAILLGVYGFGAARLSGTETTFVDGVRLRLVQPNIAQADKWKRDLRPGHVARQLEMSRQAPDAGEPPPTHIIWAETATPFVLARQPAMVRTLADAAPIKGALITGALRFEGTPNTDDFRVFNSLQVIEASGRIATTYDKFHLVPFGEYVPFYEWLHFLKITVGRGNFTAGRGLHTLDIKGLPPVSPLICYEVIFPGSVVLDGRPRPEWLLNITNDAWFGRSPGPHQHFAAARLRAVEEGLPLVRVANTGISAIVDPWGRVVAKLDLGLADVVDGGLPRPLAQATAFARHGNAIPLSLAVLALLIGGLLIGRHERAHANANLDHP